MSDEPEIDTESSAYREAGLRFIHLLQPALAHIQGCKNPTIGYWQVIYALDLSERSMRDVAAEIGVTVACISKGANEFVRENNLPRPRCMKSEEAATSYRITRENQLKQ